MQDRPTAIELLRAVEGFLDGEIVPNTEGTRRFHARVAANVLRIVARELQLEEEQLAAEWAGLDQLLGPQERPAARADLREALLRRTEELCQRIRRGDADAGPYRQRVLEHVRRTVADKLRVSDPDWLARSRRERGG